MSSKNEPKESGTRCQPKADIERNQLINIDRAQPAKPINHHPSIGSMELNMNKITSDNLLIAGEFSSLYRVDDDGKLMTIKMFDSRFDTFFLNESRIFQLPLMEHTSLANYEGSFRLKLSLICDNTDENRENIRAPSFLLFHLPPEVVTLQDHLRRQTVDWSTLCTMIKTIASGLAYIHLEVNKNRVRKPAISLNNFTSRSLLVRPDGQCLFYDLSSASIVSIRQIELDDLRPFCDNLIDEKFYLYYARYLSPEVLDCHQRSAIFAANENRLKQNDVYSFGLIMWEIVSRCVEIADSNECPVYTVPYEKEIGCDCSFGQLHNLVVKRCARPLFPDDWKDSNPALKLLRETIEDCWDHDAEARLSAFCVDERINKISTLMLNYKSYKVINKALLTSSDLIEAIECNLNHFESSCYGTKKNLNLIVRRELKVSKVGFTVEKSIQPYQGRNPCLERNLMQRVKDDQLFLVHGEKFKSILDTEKTDSQHQAVTLIRPLPMRRRALYTPNRNTNHKDFIQNEICVRRKKMKNIIDQSDAVETVAVTYENDNLENVEQDLSVSWSRKVLKQISRSGNRLRNLLDNSKRRKSSDKFCDTYSVERKSNRRFTCSRSATDDIGFCSPEVGTQVKFTAQSADDLVADGVNSHSTVPKQSFQ